MASFVRESKFRHVVLAPFKREQCYDQLKIANHPSDSDGIASNSKFFAYADAGGSGSAIAVLPLTSTGKNHVPVTAPSYQQPLIRAHAQSVSDLAFNPFDRNQLFSCSTDSTVRIWDIPSEGYVVDCSTPAMSFSGRSNPAFKGLCPHHLTSGLLAARSNRDIYLYDVTSGQELSSSPDNLFSADVQSMCWNFPGDLMAVTSKDKKLRLLDFRRSAPQAALVSEVGCHMGVRSSRCTWLGDSPFLATAGHSMSQERELMLWDSRNLTEAVQRIRIDSSTSSPLLFFDADTGLLIVGGKGDASVRLYEAATLDTPALHPIASFPTGEVAKGLTLMPKQAYDLSGCEVLRLLKVAENSVNPVSFMVPRKERLKFQEDLYPPTLSECLPSMDCSTWMNGENIPAGRLRLAPRALTTAAVETAPLELQAPDLLVSRDSAPENSPVSSVSSRMSRGKSYGSNLRLRNMYGSENPKSHTYFNVKPNTSNSDSALIACSDKYWAIPYQGSGGGPVVCTLSAVYGYLIWVFCYSTSANSKITAKLSLAVL
jgi:coronin-1B/1C/6